MASPLMSAPTFELPSSPPPPFAARSLNLSPPRASAGTKERRNPSVTPRKFRRFFTPRSHGATAVSSARQALQEIAGPCLNRNGIQSSPLRPFQGIGGLESTPGIFTRDMKRRKILHTPESTPENGCGTSKDPGFAGVHNAQRFGDIPSSPCERAMHFIEEEEDELPALPVWVPPKRIVPFADRGLAGQLLNLSIGGLGGTGRQYHVYPAEDWQDHTACFYSKPDDTHVSMASNGQDHTIPFCATGCNTNSLLAVGDEEGRVRLLESVEDGKPTFKDIFTAFKVHSNAIIDMNFSDDDSLLATASGDQSARVVDMSTQTTISILGMHSASLKQVRFQPGKNNNSVLATSSRDGSIQIWDLRCNVSNTPVHSIYAPLDTGRPTTRSISRNMQFPRPLNIIEDAHRLVSVDPISRKEISGRNGDVSVTAIQFLPSGREHLLLSASEVNSSVKLWDIRSIQSKRKVVIPLSSTKQPQSHTKFRHFGISSLNLGGDGSRLYSLCKDNTVYAYSTAHLILGQAPELSSTSQPRSLSKGTEEGIGPLYGFRHPQLHASSFYVKSAIRKAKDGKCEMLAVGSSDGCAVLFPTDEKFFPKQKHSEQPEINSPAIIRRRLGPRRIGSGLGVRLDDEIPISTHGTALIRGHDREVGSLTWTSEGDLITVGDDFIIRSWHEGKFARELRTGGESEGKRWGCGWADVCAEYDEEEG